MEATFTQHIDDLARQEIKRTIDNFDNLNDYFLLDKHTAAKKLSMSESYFYKYIVNTPEEAAIRHYPVNHKTGEVSEKAYYNPEELKQAIRHIQQHWRTRR